MYSFNAQTNHLTLLPNKFFVLRNQPSSCRFGVHAWISCERMRRIRKSIHNLANAVASSFSANSGQYLAGFPAESGFLDFGFWRSCLFTNRRLLIWRQREKTDLFLSVKAKCSSQQINQNTQITNRLMFCFFVYHTYDWYTSSIECALICVGWHCGIVSYCWVVFPQISHFHSFLFLCVSCRSNLIVYLRIVAEFADCCRKAAALNAPFGGCPAQIP